MTKNIYNNESQNNVNKGLMSGAVLQHAHSAGLLGSFPEVASNAVKEAQNLREFLGQKGVSAAWKTRFVMCMGLMVGFCVCGIYLWQLFFVVKVRYE